MKKSNMKFRVNSHEHSEAIQKRLFEMGFKWYNYEKCECIKLDSKYLFADYEDMRITHIQNDEGYYLRHGYTETTLEDITEWIPKQGEMIEVRDIDTGDWCLYEFLHYDKRLTYPYICLFGGNETLEYKQARPINPIRKEIEDLKARIKELESKL